MTQLSLSLTRISLQTGDVAPVSHLGPTVCLVHSGSVQIGAQAFSHDQGVFLPNGGEIANEGSEAAEVLAFTLSDAPLEGALVHRTIDTQFPCLIRLDEVSFPAGAQAYRHVHPGPGFRYLRKGQLSLQADDHSFEATPGDNWFEPANAPVCATASSSESETRFVRCMILPPQYQGQPTIKILDPDQAALPKKQKTHRHVDQRLDDWPYSDAG